MILKFLSNPNHTMSLRFYEIFIAWTLFILYKSLDMLEKMA